MMRLNLATSLGPKRAAASGRCMPEGENKNDDKKRMSIPISLANTRRPLCIGKRGSGGQLPRLRRRGVPGHRFGPKPVRRVRVDFSHPGPSRRRAVQHDRGAPAHRGPGDRPDQLPTVLLEAHREGTWSKGKVLVLS